MVKILIFIPKLDMKEQFKKIVEKLDEFPNINIELTHVFGTPESLSLYDEADIFVARGMTYQKLCELYPKKHIIEIQMTSFDILNAIITSKEQYCAKQIALCLPRKTSRTYENIERVLNIKIQLNEVIDEKMAYEFIENSKGIDVFVGAGTICGICDIKNLKRVHIKLTDDAVEAAISEAINTAKTLNYERASYNMLKKILNTNLNGIITIDKRGIIQQINNQIYKIFHLSTIKNFQGESIEKIFRFNWKAVIEENKTMEEIIKLNNTNRYLVQYTPISVDKINSGVIITIKNSEEILKEETKIRHSLIEKGLAAKYSFEDILGNSKAIQENKKMAKKYSKVDSNVLIIGETGTGKELFAHSIHNASARRKEPFVALNCAALPENLLESELFGYENGAFSGAARGGKIGLFELAHKGTIFLDEIGEIPITLQAKLLRVLQEKEIRRIGGNVVYPIDVRVITATNVDIEKQIKENKFRSDLYYRLNLLDLYIAPLRERRDDIQEIFDYYLAKFSCEIKNSLPKLSKEAALFLKRYSWPGNVRELRNVCERLVVLCESDEIKKEDLLQFKVFKEFLNESSDEIKEMDILKENTVVLKSKKKKQDLAKELGVSRTTLWRMLKKESK